MKRLFIVTIATLMASASFAGLIKGEGVSKIKETEQRLKELRMKDSTQAAKDEALLLAEARAKMENNFLKGEVIEKSLTDLFDGDIIKKLTFEKAHTEAKGSGNRLAEEAAKHVDIILYNLSGLSLLAEHAAHKKVLIDALQNYATLLVELSPESAAKYESQLRYLAANTHETVRNKKTMYTAEEIELVSIARVVRKDIGIADDAKLHTVKDIQDAGADKLALVKEKREQFKRDCGKKG